MRGHKLTNETHEDLNKLYPGPRSPMFNFLVCTRANLDTTHTQFIGYRVFSTRAIPGPEPHVSSVLSVQYAEIVQRPNYSPRDYMTSAKGLGQ